MEDLRKNYEELDFTDDFVFCKVLSNNEEIAKRLLELILGVKIRKVVIEKQKTIEMTADGRGIRLDVYVEDDKDTVYDLEMQTTIKRELPKRTRYYQGILDLNLIERGAKFSELKRSYIIFICKDDPFNEGLHIYTFENTCRELPTLRLGDESVKIFLNASGTADDVSDDMKDFLTLLNTGTGETDLSKMISEEVEKVRQHEEWRREYMTLHMRDQENQEIGREIGRAEGRTEGMDLLAALLQKLLAAGRNDDVQRVTRDPDYRDKLFKEFGIE